MAIKGVFDINQEERWTILSKNLKNVVKGIKELSEEYQLEVVIMGTAVNGVRKDFKEAEGLVTLDELKELVEDGVVFVVCNNTMKKFDLKKEDLYDFIKIVPAGVIELMLKQQEGYSYIKP